jgi:DNA end-binding protein Ku
MARPGHVYWRGFLRLSLVSIAVEVYSAVDSAAEIRFNQIHKPSGKRVKYEKVVPGLGAIRNEDIVKGYEVDKDVYVVLEPEELENVRLKSKKTLDLVQFADVKDIDLRWFERAYYITPADDVAAEGYLVIVEALRKAGKAGLGQITMYGREHLVAVSPIAGGLVMGAMRYANEVRPAENFFGAIPERKLDREMVELATQLIEKKSAPFDPSAFKNHYADAVRELVEEKAKGHTISAPAEEKPEAKVIDLMEALRKSVATSGGRGTPRTRDEPATPATPARAASGGGRRRGKAS